MSPEYFIIPLIMNQLNNIQLNFKTGIFILDCILILIVLVLFFVVDLKPIKYYIRTKLQTFVFTNTNNMIIIMSDGKHRSIKYRAIMYYISKLKNNKSIYCLKESVDFANDYRSEEKVEKNSEYEVDQIHRFKLDDDIYGNIIIEHKEKHKDFNNKTEIVEYNKLQIYSYKKSVTELQDWINVRILEFNKYLRLKTSDIQLLITVLQKDKDEDIIIEGVPWESTITFENSYFHQKDEIIKKIDFFLNNKQWYVERGIPYNLGILLYGEPGCGKTRFIKQIMNYTKRHAIDIKLNDCLDFGELRKIIYDDEIGCNYIVPQDKRIIIFEDIDSMGDVVKDRDLLKKDNNDTTDGLNIEDLLFEKLSDSSNKNEKKGKKDKFGKSMHKNNNLSFLLNIIDGINECSGRIIIMTTNKIDILDKALIRPGRIDMKIEFKRCNLYDIFHILKMYWKTMMPLELKLKKHKELKEELDMKYTAAEIINICRSTNNFDDIKNTFFN